jgi:serine phosphatase RsbU (regulator of sigma subunit)
MQISQHLHQLYEQKISAEKLFYHYRDKRDFEKALDYYLRYHRLSDSIINDENRLLLARNEIEYEYTKREEKFLVESQKNALQLSEERKRNYIIFFSVVAILGISLFFGYMVYKSLKLEKQAKKTVLEQKEIIEEKQKEIIDSINYAKSLQEAILPPMALWKSQLPDSFVLYKPKDIVAGDFYWMEKSQGLLFFAVADCTGHGVPGAMVSVVCSNALNRSILEFRLSDPGEILDKTRELVISTFEKSEKQVRDGMDISLCALNTQTRRLQWAGANNPLWVIHEQTLRRIAPDKQPVGEYIDELPFTTHSIQLEAGDLLYLFSDGYADQFGGPKGKKFKYKQLEELISRISGQEMAEQARILNSTFEDWKGSLGQVDDVCIIGIRV